MLDDRDIAFPRQSGGRTAVIDALDQLRRARAEDTAFVVAQLGLSLDGRIATASGDSKYINGRDALRHLHEVRALVDAVVVGAGTVQADDPRLTVRHCSGRHPARVVIDPTGRIGPDALIWAADGARRLVIGGAEALPDGVERIALRGKRIAPESIVEALAARGLKRLLVEGGADTLARFLAVGAIDCLHLLYGQVLIGSGKTGINLPEVTRLADAARPATAAHVFADGDILVACEFRRR